MQNAPANLAVVVGNIDPEAVKVFFRDNRLVQYLIRRHAGEKLSDEIYDQIYAEVCIQLLKAKPGSYDPDYAPSTYLANIVKEARRVVLAEQPMIYRPRSAPADTVFTFDEYIDETDDCDGAPNIGMRASDVENYLDAQHVLEMAPALLRNLLIEVHWNGASFKEACDETDVERTRAYRALNAFRQRLN
ncbi:sigma-70 family RNA polymerase sigma factor [Roseivivax sp. THAF40]|nr:sigma-70 family RNA polymerase sigma factor [Roseivivax sp. THAF40]